MSKYLRQDTLSLLAVLAALGLGSPAGARAASFTVEDWDLGIFVYRNGDDFAGDGFLTPINPFIAAHQVALPSNPATAAAAQYDISWLMNYGSFNIAAQLAAQDGNSVRSLASGTIYLQSDVAFPLTLSVDAALNYNLPTYGLYASLGFAVRDVTANEYIFGTTQTYDSVTGPPAAGLLSITADVVLPANHQFRIQYGMGLDTFGYSSGLATADGHVNFTISPEPATAWLLALGALGLLKRTRRRRSRHRS